MDDGGGCLKTRLFKSDAQPISWLRQTRRNTPITCNNKVVRNLQSRLLGSSETHFQLPSCSSREIRENLAAHQREVACRQSALLTVTAAAGPVGGVNDVAALLWNFSRLLLICLRYP